MYDRILVALDNSELSRDVATQAIALAQSIKAKLTLLHVLSSDEGISPTMPLIPVPEYYPSLSVATLELYQEEWKAFQAKSLALLESYRTEAETAGITVDCFQKVGRPGRTICEVAKAVNADLIMVGRRGHSGLNEFLIGSVSNYVVHHAPISVLVCNLKVKSLKNTAPQNNTPQNTITEPLACAIGENNLRG
jgi:nucleotide-binding universal stress UspA family protein